MQPIVINLIDIVEAPDQIEPLVLAQIHIPHHSQINLPHILTTEVNNDKEALIQDLVGYIVSDLDRFDLD